MTEIVNPFNVVTDLTKNIFLTEEHRNNLKEELCSQNFMDSLEYMENFVKFICVLETIMDVNDVEFLSTYISLGVSQKLNINVLPEVYELRYFEILVRDFVEKDCDIIEDKFIDMCDDIKYNGNKITFILK